MNRKRVPAAYLPVFCRELNQLVRAGIPLGEGVSMLREDERDPALRGWLDTLCQSIEEGAPLSAALRETGAFPVYLTDMIHLAENTGKLQDVLPALARHYDRQQRLASDLRGALVVPLTLLVVMVAVVVLLMTQVLPIFERVFAMLGVRMGALASALLNAGAALARAGVALGAAVAVLAVAAVVVAAVPALREKFTAWFRLNFGGKGILREFAAARFASSLSMSVASGMDMEDCVDLSAGLCGGAREIDRKTALCRERIREGGSLADALAECGMFAGRDCRLLKLAERTGTLPDTLEDMAVRQEEAASRKLDGLVGAIEPAVVVVSGILAGVILVSVMLPLMSLLSTIG